MRDHRRPTPEAIEAALSALRPIENDDDARTFHEIVSNNRNLALQILSFGAFVGEPEYNDASLSVAKF